MTGSTDEGWRMERQAALLRPGCVVSPSLGGVRQVRALPTPKVGETAS